MTECPPLSLKGLFACRPDAPSPSAVVTIQRCDGRTVAKALYTGHTYSSVDGGVTFVCDQSAACPPSAEASAALCLQP